jgi:hypothetical protein
MTNRTIDDRDREALQREYERVASDIRGIETSNDKAIGFGLTVVGVGLAYGIKEDIAVVFPFLPIALIGVFLYGILQYHNLFWLGGYKRAVEEKINEISGRTVICWEDLVQTKRRRINAINIGLTTVYVLVLVAVTSISSEKVFAAFGPTFGVIFGFVELALLVLLLFGIHRMFRGYDDALAFGRMKLLANNQGDELE